jgi:hypothetical protein
VVNIRECGEVNKVSCFICLLSSDVRPSPWTAPDVKDSFTKCKKTKIHRKNEFNYFSLPYDNYGVLISRHHPIQ